MKRAVGHRERGLLREAKRGAALAPAEQPKPETRDLRGRKIEKVTEERIILAARLQRQGLKPYKMIDLLYPPNPNLPKQQISHDRRKRFERQSKFLLKYRERIAAGPQAAQTQAAQNVVD
jgi:hypothetical protein